MKKTILRIVLICLVGAAVVGLYPRDDFYPDQYATVSRSWIITKVDIDDPNGCQVTQRFFYPLSTKSVDYYLNTLCNTPNQAPHHQTISDTQGDEQDTIYYSNLADEQSREYVRNLLTSYDIPKQNIDNFFYYVDYYNNAIQYNGLVQSGFTVMLKEDPYRSYDYLKILEDADSDFMGTNCRITTFTLMKDMIGIGSGSLELGAALPFDDFAIDSFPKSIFSPEDRREYHLFFHGIPTPLVSEQATHIDNIQNYQSDYNISYPAIAGLSLISVYTHDEIDSVLFVGHMGLLLEDGNNYVFIEKLSFDLPYQAVIFQSKQQLHDYLMDKYGRYTSDQTTDPFIMENDILMNLN